jgi:hypothetical protein
MSSMLSRLLNLELPTERGPLVWLAKRAFFLAIALCLAAGVTSCKSRPPELKSGGSESSTDAPLTTFNQKITSTSRELTVGPGGSFQIPVTISNPTNETWSSAGNYPVNVSYKWFENGVMLPIEGDRTLLPARVPPGGSVPVVVKGTAPQSGQNLTLKVTLVQEGVAWFMMKDAPCLEISVHMK